MGLRDITIHQTTVKYRDETISVRGISTEDIMVAAQDYGPEIAMIFGKVTSGEFDGDIKKAVFNFVRESPVIMAATIALASDDYSPESVKTARRLPVGIQVELIEAVFNETFYSEADVKKLLESLNKALVAISGVLSQTTLPASINGIGGFADKLAS